MHTHLGWLSSVGSAKFRVPVLPGTVSVPPLWRLIRSEVRYQFETSFYITPPLSHGHFAPYSYLPFLSCQHTLHALFCHSPSCFTDVNSLHLPDLGSELVDLSTCLNSLHAELNWSNEFHKNQYFGEGMREPMTIPPSPPPPTVIAPSLPPQAIHQKGANPPIAPIRMTFTSCLMSLKMYIVLTWRPSWP